MRGLLVKVIDFGLARRAVTDAAAQITLGGLRGHAAVCQPQADRGTRPRQPFGHLLSGRRVVVHAHEPADVRRTSGTGWLAALARRSAMGGASAPARAGPRPACAYLAKEGHTGRVFRAEDMCQGGRAVAVKVWRAGLDRAALLELQADFRRLRAAPHPRLLEAFSCDETRGHWFLASAWVNGFTLVNLRATAEFWNCGRPYNCSPKPAMPPPTGASMACATSPCLRTRSWFISRGRSTATRLARPGRSWTVH